jgi:hypothetical protein
MADNVRNARSGLAMTFEYDVIVVDNGYHQTDSGYSAKYFEQQVDSDGLAQRIPKRYS